MRKKLLTGLLAVAMVLSLCACGKTGTEAGMRLQQSSMKIFLLSRSLA